MRIYWQRVQRGDEFFGINKLGAVGTDLGALYCFFESPWKRVVLGISDANKPRILITVASVLRALGRLTEAIEPCRAGLEKSIKQKMWTEASQAANNLSEFELTLGNVAAAVAIAAQSVLYADRSGEMSHKILKRTALANAQHEAGHRLDAQACFREAEKMQSQDTKYQLLYSLQGFQYCDLLLGESQRAAWQKCLQRAKVQQNETILSHIQSCREVEQRTGQTSKWVEQEGNLLDIALDQLTMGRVALYCAIFEDSALSICRSLLQNAVDGLRRAAAQEFIVTGLLSRAWLKVLEDESAGALIDLDEAWQIVERSPMRLHMTDIHLHRARLFFREKAYP
jgi:tetratricopeptide (TPR) repeat protein